METPRIPFNKPFVVGKELYYIAQAVMAGHLSGDGFYTKQCHLWLEERLGCGRAFLTHSCTAALEMAAILADLHPGDEVVMPSFTFVSTANAVVLRGAVPVFVDIRADSLNIDERLIEAAVTPRTRMIVVVHYAGMPCAMDEIMAIGRKYDLVVVEDAAQALLSRYRGRYLGSIGHLGCLSFHETKNVISGEGGALLVNAPEFVKRAEIIREKGTNRCQFFRGEVDKYTWVDVGSSYLPSELVGAFLCAQLEHSDEINAARCRIFDLYYESLRPLEQQGRLLLPFIPSDCATNGHLFYIITGSLEERTRLIDHLKSMGVLAVFHYVPLHSSPGGRRFGRVSGDMAVSDDISDRLLRLPLYYGMSDQDVAEVVSRINEFYAGPG